MIGLTPNTQLYGIWKPPDSEPSGVSGKLSALPTEGAYGASPFVPLIRTEPITKSTFC